MRKKTMRSLFSFVLAMAIFITSVPFKLVEAEDAPPAGPATIHYGLNSPAYYDLGIQTARTLGTIEPGFARSLGYESAGLTANAGSATMFDALARAVYDVYGEDLKSTKYYRLVFEDGVLKQVAGAYEQPSANTFYALLNGTRIGLDKLDTTVVHNGDEVSFLWVRSSVNNLYSWFEDQAGGTYAGRIVVAPNEPVVLQLKGYDLSSTEGADAARAIAGAEIGTTGLRGTDYLGAFTSLEQTTDADGQVTLHFEKPGQYVVTANTEVSVEGAVYKTNAPQSMIIVKDDTSTALSDLRTAMYQANAQPTYTGASALFDDDDTVYFMRATSGLSNINGVGISGVVPIGAKAKVDGQSVSVDDTGWFEGKLDPSVGHMNTSHYGYHRIDVTSADNSTTKSYYVLLLYKGTQEQALPKLSKFQDGRGKELDSSKYTAISNNGGYYSFTDGDVMLMGDYNHVYQSLIANEISAVRVQGSMLNAVDGLRVRKINKDGSLGSYIDGTIGPDGKQFATGTVSLDKGFNYLLFETKAIGDSDWTAYGILNVYREKTVGVSSDTTVTPADLKFQDAQGNALVPVQDAADSKLWLIRLPAGAEQNKVTASLLRIPDGATSSFGDSQRVMNLSTNMTDLSREYTQDLSFDVTAANRFSNSRYAYRIVRAAMPPTASNATLLYKGNVQAKNTTGAFIPAYQVGVRKIDPATGWGGVSVVPTADLTLTNDDTWLVTSDQSQLDANQLRVASIYLKPELLYPNGGSTYSIVVNKTNTIADRKTAGEYNIPHVGGYSYPIKVGDQVVSTIDTTYIEVIVHAPPGINAENKTYTYIVPKQKPAAASFSNVTTASGTDVGFKSGEGVLRVEGKSTTAFVESELNYYVNVNYNMDKIVLLPTVPSNDIVMSWSQGSGEFTTIPQVINAKAIVPLTVGENIVRLKGTVGASEKIYTFKITREEGKNFNLKSVRFTDSSIVPAGMMRATRLSQIGIADRGTATYGVTYTAEDPEATLTVTQGDYTISGIGTVTAEGLDTALPAKVRIWDGVHADKNNEYTQTIRFRHPTAPSRTYEIMPAPGQFVNELSQTVTGTATGFGWGEGWDTSIYATDEEINQSGTGSPGVSLGSFGGYVSYQFDEPIKNGPNNAYGVDFMVQGNPFIGNNEPAGVMVAQDKDRDGKPDRWFNLAGSEHYEDKTDWNYSVTYTNPDPGFTPNIGQNVPWSDNKGNIGVITYNTFHKQIYYPNSKNYLFEGNAAKDRYDPEKMTFTGVNINTLKVGFGYADTTVNSQNDQIVKGNPYVGSYSDFDIDWAVDDDGMPIKLDEISFIKVFTNQLTDGGLLGEKSPEVLSVLRKDKGTAVAGKTEAPSRITLTASGHDDLSVPIQAGKAVYDVYVGDMQFVKAKVSAKPGDVIYFNNQKIGAEQSTDTSYEVTADHPRLIRVVTQNGTKEPSIVMLRLKSGAKPVQRLLTALKAERTGAEITLSQDTTDQYSVTVPYTTTSIQVKPTVVSGAIVTVDGNPLSAGGKSEAIALAVGATTISIVAKLGEQTETSTLTVHREAGPADNGTITATFSLLGMPKHDGAGPLLVYKNNPDKMESWIAPKRYTLPAGSTVLDLFDKALTEAGLAYVNSFGGNYISSIQSPGGVWMSEFTNGQYSGWMYTVNGTHPQIGLAQYVLSNGQNVVWHYTDDYRYEEGAEPWLGENTGGDTGANAGELTKKTELTATKGEDGTATATLAGAKLEAFLSDLSKLKDTAGSGVVIGIDVPEGSTSFALTLSKDALAKLAGRKQTTLSIQTAAGSFVIDAKALSTIGANAGGQDAVVSMRLLKSADLTDRQSAIVGDRPVFDLILAAGDKQIKSFDGGTVRALLPYKLQNGERAANLTVAYLPDNGEAVEMSGAAYDPQQSGIWFTTDHFSKFAIALASNSVQSFVDVPNTHWASAYIESLASRGIMEGVGNGKFAPDRSVTRAEFAAMLFRLSGDAKPAADTSFADVPATSWYAAYAAWASKLGVTKGKDAAKFAPSERITRQDLVTMLSRYLSYKGLKLTNTQAQAAFADQSRIADYAEGAVNALQQAGIVAGKGGGKFEPGAQATRAEAAKMLALIVEKAK
ncbi:S-layer homology domain-containing protein [Cohnella sp. GCM10020058]|uniref:S-layer homology domain-containing protein n=1 Tax=Cohnella sp. GCM10020058 TaxID=3317330 RepID=UPI0036252E89